MRNFIISLFIVLFLPACAALEKERVIYFSVTPKQYSAQQQVQVASELQKCDCPGLTEMINDYGQLREALREQTEMTE